MGYYTPVTKTADTRLAKEKPHGTERVRTEARHTTQSQRCKFLPSTVSSAISLSLSPTMLVPTQIYLPASLFLVLVIISLPLRIWKKAQHNVCTPVFAQDLTSLVWAVCVHESLSECTAFATGVNMNMNFVLNCAAAKVSCMNMCTSNV